MDDSMYTVIDMIGAVKLSISPKFHKFIILYLYRHYRYRLTRVVPDKGPLNGCVCVCYIGTIYKALKALNAFSALKALCAFSALTLLVGQQEGHPACKKTVVGYWRGYLSGTRCRLAYGLADQLMPLPLTVSCSSEIQIGTG